MRVGFSHLRPVRTLVLMAITVAVGVVPADEAETARLRRDLAAFQALPPERQEKLRQLDRRLQEEDSATAARLTRVLQRYADWLERLPAADRTAIDQAPTAAERLRLIRATRERQLAERLPARLRERTPKEQWPALLKQVQREDRQLRGEWQVAARHWRELLDGRPLPSRAADFGDEAVAFINDYLRKLITDEEDRRLREAEGRWPQYPMLLVELADRYPLPFPGLVGPRRLTDLPPELQARIKWQRGQFRHLLAAEGRWPDFALELRNLPLVKRGLAPGLHKPAWAPTRPDDFPPRVEVFIRQRLRPPTLTDDEADRLKRAAGEWPLYPRTVMELAWKHGLTVPDTGLPGPAQRWDRYRLRPAAGPDALPEPAERSLREFAGRELHADTERDLPLTREEIKRAYFQRFPNEFLRLRQADLQKKQNKGKGPTGPVQ